MKRVSYGATIDLYGMGAEYYDAVINLQVAVKDATPGASGVLSEFIDLQIVVRDVDEAEFSGDFHAYVVEDERVENDHIYARGVVNIDKMPYDATFTINGGAGVTEANGIYTVALDYGTFTYNLESGEWVYAVENAHDDVQSMNAPIPFPTYSALRSQIGTAPSPHVRFISTCLVRMNISICKGMAAPTPMAPPDLALLPSLIATQHHVTKSMTCI